jgi:hypothetical protein
MITLLSSVLFLARGAYVSAPIVIRIGFDQKVSNLKSRQL